MGEFSPELLRRLAQEASFRRPHRRTEIGNKVINPSRTCTLPSDAACGKFGNKPLSNTKDVQNFKDALYAITMMRAACLLEGQADKTRVKVTLEIDLTDAVAHPMNSRPLPKKKGGRYVRDNGTDIDTNISDNPADDDDTYNMITNMIYGHLALACG